MYDVNPKDGNHTINTGKYAQTTNIVRSTTIFEKRNICNWIIFAWENKYWDPIFVHAVGVLLVTHGNIGTTVNK